ncbi:MAG: HPr family phosphocarrier protein [Pseudomonadota bacterium]
MSEPVFERSVIISNHKGLHARASAKLAKLAATLPTKVMVSHNGETADARSIMDLLCLGASVGKTVHLSAAGSQAEAALDQIESLIKEGFGELDEEDSSCK